MLESVGVDASERDSGIFAGVVDGALVMLEIYVDNLFISCETMKLMDSIKSKLSSTFTLKD